MTLDSHWISGPLFLSKHRIEHEIGLSKQSPFLVCEDSGRFEKIQQMEQNSPYE